MADGSSDSRTSIIVALIVAAGTVLAAVIGLFSGAVEIPSLTGRPGSSELEQTVQSLEGKVNELEQRNGELEDQLAEASGVGTGSGTVSAADDDVEVVRQTDGPLHLDNYSCITLDNTAPDWDATDYQGDFCLSSGFVEGENLTVFDDEPNHADCDARAQLASSTRCEGLLDKFVCFHSDGGRTARVHFTKIAPGPDSTEIDVEVLVWKE